MEAAFSILAGCKTQAGGLEASSDKTKGQRYNEDKKGVYFHNKRDMSSALSYAHWVPLFADGCYVRILLECKVDRSHRVPYKHKDQKVQQPNSECKRAGSEKDPYTGGPSIFFARMHVQIVGFQDIPKDDMYGMIWNEHAEARPEYIDRLYGTNQDESICLVVFPPEIETEFSQTSQGVTRVTRKVPCDAVTRDTPDPHATGPFRLPPGKRFVPTGELSEFTVVEEGQCSACAMGDPTSEIPCFCSPNYTHACSICGVTDLEKDWRDHHNAMPLAEGKCCDDCHPKVLATRLEASRRDADTETVADIAFGDVGQEPSEESWEIARNVFTLNQQYNPCLELGWIEKMLAGRKYMVETREHKKDSGRLKVYVYETRRQGNKNIIVPRADIYYSAYNRVVGTWLVVGRADWERMPDYYRELRGHVLELARLNLGDTQNSLVQDSRAAAALRGPSITRAPQAVVPAPLRNGSTPWAVLFQDHADRFHADMVDWDILSSKMQIPPKSTWEGTALPKHRSTPDPMTLPIAKEMELAGWDHGVCRQKSSDERTYGRELRRKYKLPWNAQDATPQQEQVNALNGIPFRRYAIEFIELISTFTKMRAPWLELLPADDAMHYDEIALRTLEGQVLQEFLKEQYPLGYWQGAHSLEARIKSIPEVGGPGTPARLDRFLEERRTEMCRTVANMKKGYELARAAMGDEPTSETLTSFDRMLRLLQDAQNASREGHLNTVRGLTIRERGVGLLGSGSRSNKMKSTAFDGQHGHIVEFHISRAVEQGPGGGTWIHGAVTASDEDMMDAATGSLVDQADPVYAGLPCLEASEILRLIQPLSVIHL